MHLPMYHPFLEHLFSEECGLKRISSGFLFGRLFVSVPLFLSRGLGVPVGLDIFGPNCELMYFLRLNINGVK